jgi:hypothetical protein
MSEYIELQRDYRKWMENAGIDNLRQGKIKSIAEMIEKVAPGCGFNAAKLLALEGPVDIGDWENAVSPRKHAWLLAHQHEKPSVLAQIAGYSSNRCVTVTLVYLRKQRAAKHTR